MKKIIAVFLMLVVMLSWTSVDAASLCSYERQVELKKIASAVKLTYEEAEEEVDPDTYGPPDSPVEGDGILYRNYFEIKLLNLTEDIYVKLENSYNDDVKYIRYEDTDEGTFSIDWKNTEEVVTFTYTIFTSNKTECVNEKLSSGMFTIPKYNRYHNSVICEDIPDYYLCQKYISTNVTFESFYENVNYYLEKNKNEDKNEEEKEKGKVVNNIFDFLKDNKIIIIASILFVGGVVTTVIVVKKRRSRVL